MRSSDSKNEAKLIFDSTNFPTKVEDSSRLRGKHWIEIVLKAAILGRKYLVNDQVTPIRNSHETRKIEELLYREYRSRNLCNENQSLRHYSAHSLLPTTHTLVSRSNNNNNNIVGTISVIGDGAIGLPSDLLYKQELDALRDCGHNLVEIGLMALDNSRFRRKTYSLKSAKKSIAMFSMFAGTINYLYQATNASHLVIMVNPKHKEIYDFFGFEQFSEIRHYPRVNKPAVPMILSLDRFLASANTHVPALFVTSCMSIIEERREYRVTNLDIIERAVTNPEYFLALSEDELSVLTNLYHGLAETLNLICQLNGDNYEIKQNNSAY
jgi:hypothetical protein